MIQQEQFREQYAKEFQDVCELDDGVGFVPGWDQFLTVEDLESKCQGQCFSNVTERIPCCRLVPCRICQTPQRVTDLLLYGACCELCFKEWNQWKQDSLPFRPSGYCLLCRTPIAQTWRRKPQPSAEVSLSCSFCKTIVRGDTPAFACFNRDRYHKSCWLTYQQARLAKEWEQVNEEEVRHLKKRKQFHDSVNFS